MNPLRFKVVEDRLTDARDAIAALSATPQFDPAWVLSLQRTAADVQDAARLFEDAHLLFIKIENLLTIIEWQIERLSPLRGRDSSAG